MAPAAGLAPPSLVYLTPTFANPSGNKRCRPAHRRSKLAAPWPSVRGFLLRAEGRRGYRQPFLRRLRLLPPIARHSDRVVRLGSVYSNVCSVPASRWGWTSAPPERAQRARPRAKQATLNPANLAATQAPPSLHAAAEQCRGLLAATNLRPPPRRCVPEPRRTALVTLPAQRIRQPYRGSAGPSGRRCSCWPNFCRRQNGFRRRAAHRCSGARGVPVPSRAVPSPRCPAGGRDGSSGQKVPAEPGMCLPPSAPRNVAAAESVMLLLERPPPRIDLPGVAPLCDPKVRYNCLPRRVFCSAPDAGFSHVVSSTFSRAVFRGHTGLLCWELLGLLADPSGPLAGWVPVAVLEALRWRRRRLLGAACAVAAGFRSFAARPGGMPRTEEAVLRSLIEDVGWWLSRADLARAIVRQSAPRRVSECLPGRPGPLLRPPKKIAGRLRASERTASVWAMRYVAAPVHGTRPRRNCVLVPAPAARRPTRPVNGGASGREPARPEQIEITRMRRLQQHSTRPLRPDETYPVHQVPSSCAAARRRIFPG